MKRLMLAVLFALTIIGAEAQSPAGTISVAWDPVADSAGATIAGYKVCIGQTPESLGGCDTVGKITQHTISGLQDCQTYYVGVKARDTDGDESGSFAGVVSGWSAPRIGAIVPATTQAGRLTQLTITGAGFGPTTTLAVSGGIVSSVTVGNCNSMTATVSVSAAGTPTFTATTAGVVGRATGLFQVAEAVRPGVVSGVRRAEM